MLSGKKFLIKEKMEDFTAQREFEILQADSQQKVGKAKESERELLSSADKHSDNEIAIFDNCGDTPCLVLNKPDTLIVPRVDVYDTNNRMIAFFKGNLLPIKRNFCFFDVDGKKIGEVTGGVVGWNFKIKNKKGQEVGSLSKKSGLLKEVTLGANDFVVELYDDAEVDMDPKTFALAAGFAMEMAYS